MAVVGIPLNPTLVVVYQTGLTTAGGKTFAITIPNPRVDLQQAEVMAAMDSIIANDLFLTSSGALTGIRDIKAIDTTTNDLFDPPQA